jgi:hypothetical protein
MYTKRGDCTWYTRANGTYFRRAARTYALRLVAKAILLHLLSFSGRILSGHSDVLIGQGRIRSLSAVLSRVCVEVVGELAPQHLNVLHINLCAKFISH